MDNLVVLNDGQEPAGQSDTAGWKTLMDRLRKAILKLKADYITEEGVDYKAMGASEAFSQYKALAATLRRLDLKPLIEDEMERKAFFINLYNVQMIHGLVVQEDLPASPIKVQVGQNFKVKHCPYLSCLELALNRLELVSNF